MVAPQELGAALAQRAEQWGPGAMVRLGYTAAHPLCVGVAMQGPTDIGRERAAVVMIGTNDPSDHGVATYTANAKRAGARDEFPYWNIVLPRTPSESTLGEVDADLLTRIAQRSGSGGVSSVQINDDNLYFNRAPTTPPLEG